MKAIAITEGIEAAFADRGAAWLRRKVVALVEAAEAITPPEAAARQHYYHFPDGRSIVITVGKHIDPISAMLPHEATELRQAIEAARRQQR